MYPPADNFSIVKQACSYSYTGIMQPVSFPQMTEAGQCRRRMHRHLAPRHADSCDGEFEGCFHTVSPCLKRLEASCTCLRAHFQAECLGV